MYRVLLYNIRAMLNGEDYFKALYHHSRTNGVVLMDKDGIIQEVNDAFTEAYGYQNDDLKSKHFRLLYTKEDQTLLRPEIEINTTLREGSSSDENYLVRKDGTPLWVTGESILVKAESELGILKVIHNIHAQKQLERYLLGSNEMLDHLFNSTTSGLLLLDGRLRTVKANAAFLKIFGRSEPIAEGSKLQEIGHPFWDDIEVKTDIRDVFTKGIKLKKEYIIGNDKNDFHKIEITSKMLSDHGEPEARLLVVIKEL